jgi:uncharacterized protein YjbJ (UPF0337 family)
LSKTRHTEESIMNTDHAKGAADKAKGAVEDTAGEVLGDTKLQAEGKLDKAKGAARSAVGDVKDAVKSAKIAQGDEGPSANGE